MKVLMLGSKEYPMGSNKGDDPLPSGGMEIYIEELVNSLMKYPDLEIIIITRKFASSLPFEQKGNVKVYRVPFNRGFYLRNPTFNLMAFMKSLKIDFDVIISNGDIANVLGLFLSRIKRRPIIMACHGIASEQPQYNLLIKFLFRIMEKTAYSNADVVITHSPHQVKKLTKSYDIIFPGLDRERLQTNKDIAESIRNRYKIGNKKIILFTGRLFKVKGLEYLIKSLPFVKHGYVCFIVGEGPSKKEYELLAKDLGVNAVFAGFRSDVANFLSLADVFVLPSVGESLNYSMLEAAYMKVPIVVTDLKILPEGCGMIVPKRDEKAIANAINSIIENESMRREMIERAYEYTKKFNWETAGKKYHEIIKRFER